MFSFLLSAWLLGFQPPTYSAVVVDAATNRPLAGVLVRTDGSGTAVTSTDTHGRFTLAGLPQGIGLSLPGYAPLHVAMPAQLTTADTLRLLPRSYALDEVAVRPPRSSTLASVPAGGPALGRRLFPGQAVALLLERPASAPADQPCVVSEVRLFLSERPHQGRLRVRLVELLAGPPAQPGIRDLLPTPAVFTLDQLAQARKGILVLDVSAANLLLPAAGLCVVIECLPTDPADQTATITIAPGVKGHTTVTLTGGAPSLPPRTYPAQDFPLLTAGRGAGAGTWSYYPNRPVWTARSAVSYTVRTEVRLLSY